jgi:RNA-directed DNA polymerase
VKSLTEQVREIQTLGRAWRVIYENGRSSQSLETRREIEEFASNAISRLTRIQRQLNRNTFRFAPAKGVAMRKPGKRSIRPIVIAPVESRIVQRAIHDTLLKIPSIRQYAEDPFSFGGVRRAEGQTTAAVPAAIQAVLEAIEHGANYVIRSDITSFFACIPKSTVTAMVEQCTMDAEFMDLFREAIAVELRNLSALRQWSAEFPIHEIGVAQGNSLSPLLGNILLYDFDLQMNAGDSRCLRYVDDFMILAQSRQAAEHQFSRAIEMLRRHCFTVNDKTLRASVNRPFTFLGIDFSNGAIRPSEKSRKRLLTRVSNVLNAGACAFHSHKKTHTIARSESLIRTLYEVSGIVAGWGKHYSFCNEKNIFRQLDDQLSVMLRKYLGSYGDAANRTDSMGRRHLLGVPLLEELVSRPLSWKRVPSSGPCPTLSSAGAGAQPTA